MPLLDGFLIPRMARGQRAGTSQRSRQKAIGVWGNMHGDHQRRIEVGRQEGTKLSQSLNASGGCPDHHHVPIWHGTSFASCDDARRR